MRKQMILIPVILLLLLGYYFFFLKSDELNYIITASTESGGSINPVGDIVVADGGDQSFTVTPYSGYHIADVLVNGVSVGAVGVYDFTAVSADHTIAASFEADEYILTVNIVGDGSVSLDPSQPTYHYGDVVEFTAAADPGWAFSSWGGDLSGSANPESITMDGDKTVTATFSEAAWTIAASAELGGSISPSDDVSVPDGSDQSFTVTPDAGYHIADVLVDDVSVGAVGSYEFTGVTSDHTIEALFEADAITWTIAASAGAGGSISPSGDVVVADGGSQGFTVSPGVGYHISDVLVDDVSVGPVGSYEFTGVSADHTIEVVFEKTSVEPGTLSHLWSYLGEIYDVEISSNGEYLAASSEFVFNCYRINNPEAIWTAINEYEAVYWGVAISDDGDSAVVGDDAGRINFFTEATKKSGYISSSWSSNYLGRGVRRETLDISKSGDIVAVAGRDGLIHVYKDSTVKTGNNLIADWLVETSATEIVKLVLDPDGKYLVSCGSIMIAGNQHILLTYLDLATESILWHWVSPFPGAAHDMEMSGDGNVVTLALTDHSSITTGIYCWMDATSLRGVLDPLPSWRYTTSSDSISRVAMSLNGNDIAAGTLDNGNVFYWSDASGQNGEKLSPDWSKSISVQDIELSSDGNLIVVSALKDQQWQIMMYSENGSLEGEIQVAFQITNLATSNDGYLIAFAQSYSSIDVYRYKP